MISEGGGCSALLYRRRLGAGGLELEGAPSRYPLPTAINGSRMVHADAMPYLFTCTAYSEGGKWSACADSRTNPRPLGPAGRETVSRFVLSS